MARTQLIAFDIDGTLIPPGAHHESLPDAAITRVVEDLVAAGVVVVLASGRMYPGTERVARHLHLDAPLICQQGASVHRADGSVSHSFVIDPDIANEMAAYSIEHGWPFAWFDSVRYLASARTEQTDFFGLVSGVAPEYRPDPHLAGVVPTGIDIVSTREAANGVHQEMAARYGDRVHLLDFPSVTAAHAPLASKGNGLMLVAEDLGIDRNAVIAIGDSVNDESMLRWAGRGVAMPHSDRYARDAADEILSGDGIEGLVPFLREILRSID